MTVASVTRHAVSLFFRAIIYICFFFNDTATTEIYTLSLHDALPICTAICSSPGRAESESHGYRARLRRDRKSTRLNSSHHRISYAVFCLKKQNNREKRSDRAPRLSTDRTPPRAVPLQTACCSTQHIQRSHCTPVLVSPGWFFFF